MFTGGKNDWWRNWLLMVSTVTFHCQWRRAGCLWRSNDCLLCVPCTPTVTRLNILSEACVWCHRVQVTVHNKLLQIIYNWSLPCAIFLMYREAPAFRRSSSASLPVRLYSLLPASCLYSAFPSGKSFYDLSAASWPRNEAKQGHGRCWHMDWEDFCKEYSIYIDRVPSGSDNFQPLITPLQWGNAMRRGIPCCFCHRSHPPFCRQIPE